MFIILILDCKAIGNGDRPPPRRALVSRQTIPAPPRPVLSIEFLPVATIRFWWAPFIFDC
ncbi:hypothetical protein HanXRQr2_Chr17g0824601 [Helianthus annuus]|uniref:Uncharacterized protein n=1 Tax=Helianthus annuus TaxID=4232 RepID=A0A9K3DNI8_HELAN|nr:hypothetical protein HanXRQr2_Chr17g0824601 [Helianthus annuus]